jgi:hypothetical protein
VVHDDEPVGLDGLRGRVRRSARGLGCGLVLVGTLARRLGIEGLAVRLVQSARCAARGSIGAPWRAVAGAGDGRLVVDVDSLVCEVCGRLKQGAAYGYTKLLGYHPILATRADTRECCTSVCVRAQRTRRRGCCASPRS